MEKDDAWSDIIAPSLLEQARRPKIAAANQLPWIRTALAFVHFDAVLFESLAEKIGIQCATEVLLLAIARACEKKKPLWVQARDLGIPWVAKTWSGLGKLQRRYNDGVRLHPLESIEEGAGTEFHDDDAESISGSLFFKSPGTAAIAVSDPAFLAAPEDTSTRKVTGPYAARPGLGRPPPYPAPIYLRIHTTSAGKNIIQLSTQKMNTQVNAAKYI